MEESGHAIKLREVGVGGWGEGLVYNNMLKRV